MTSCSLRANALRVPTGTTYKIRNLPYRRAFGDFHFMIASLPDRNNNDLSSACGSEKH
jgi:hypothetical protein